MAGGAESAGADNGAAGLEGRLHKCTSQRPAGQRLRPSTSASPRRTADRSYWSSTGSESGGEPVVREPRVHSLIDRCGPPLRRDQHDSATSRSGNVPRCCHPALAVIQCPRVGALRGFTKCHLCVLLRDNPPIPDRVPPRSSLAILSSPRARPEHRGGQCPASSWPGRLARRPCCVKRREVLIVQWHRVLATAAKFWGGVPPERDVGRPLPCWVFSL
jgi:hypothetical protein